MSAILPVITHPNPLLRQQARLISIAEIHDAAMQQLYQNMITTMYADDGIGLAAPQVGQSIRVITVGKDAFEDQKNLPFGVQDMVFINPELSEYSFNVIIIDIISSNPSPSIPSASVVESAVYAVMTPSIIT